MTDQPKFTPGPWMAEEQDSWWVTSGAGEVCEIMPWSNECDKADAHLIAAAPEMYEALEAVQDHLAISGSPLQCFIKFALAKARGEIS